LFIDTSVAGVCRSGLLDGSRNRIKTERGRASLLLPTLSRLGLKALTSIAGVCVVEGPGSFSAVRSGVLTANLLSRLLRVPLVGIETRNAEDLERLTARLFSNDIPLRAFVAPVYDAEPNITRSSA